MKNDGVEISSILKSFFDKKKKENRGVSIRGLAQKLQISSSYLHQILKGERVGTPALYEELCRLLDVDPEKRDFVLNRALAHKGLLREVSVGLRQDALETFSSRHDWISAPKADFKFLKIWYYIPILECTRLKKYDGTPEFVAGKLGLELYVVKSAMQELESAGYLVVHEGLLRKASDFLDFNSAHNKDEIRAFHSANMGLAQQALKQKTDLQDVEERLITSFTFGCKSEDMAIVKQKISAFIQTLSVEHAKGDGDEVYQFAVQFFPLKQAPSPKSSR